MLKIVTFNLLKWKPNIVKTSWCSCPWGGLCKRGSSRGSCWWCPRRAPCWRRSPRRSCFRPGRCPWWWRGGRVSPRTHYGWKWVLLLEFLWAAVVPTYNEWKWWLLMELSQSNVVQIQVKCFIYLFLFTYAQWYFN